MPVYVIGDVNSNNVAVEYWCIEAYTKAYNAVSIIQISIRNKTQNKYTKAIKVCSL